MLLFFLFYIFVIPVCVLMHEIGHGVGVVSLSKLDAHIYLGKRSQENKENFRIGRFRFHIHWSYIGFVDWKGDLNKRQRIAALAGGPIMSFLLVFIFAAIGISLPPSDLKSFFWGASTFNLGMVVWTVIPITYPRWMGPYYGHPSDGLQLLRLQRK
ncbi:M50 family metallopeptidase [Sutcliffiella horikoshii]|uniref:M50 family metallopeptidase n=2 Tax=Bacillales TaxID=1385 RepID=UPI0001E897F9|nr:M50 family metallopeptidase [Bacillus sp. m3-13]